MTKRREYLITSGSLVATLLAGCPGNETTQSTERPTETATETEESSFIESTSTPEEETESAPALTVNSTGVTVETGSEAKIAGQVSLTNIDTAKAYVQYRPTESNTWQDAQAQELSEGGDVSVTVSDLSFRSEYEYRIVAESGDIRSTTESKTFVTVPYEKPEARFTVAQDGSGDYETLEEAHRVADEDDVIKVREGEYSLALQKPLKFVGEGRSLPTITLDVSNNLGGLLVFYDVVVDAPDKLSNTWIDAYGAEFTTPVSGEDIVAKYTDFRRSLNSKEELEVTASTFEGDISASTVTMDSVTVPESVSFDVTLELTATNCEINPQISGAQGSGVRGSATQTTFKSGISTDESYNFKGCRIYGLQLTGNTVAKRQSKSQVTCTNCRITPGPNLDVSIDVPPADTFDSRDRISVPELRNCTIGEEGTTVAMRVDAGGAKKGYPDGGLYNCEVIGVIDTPKPTSMEIIGNVFRLTEGDAYFIDGEVHSVILNSFRDGGDVRINSSGTNMYDGSAELGNYYSAWDRSDSKDSGIIDVPRPIPGDGGVVDDYPLASSDLSKYER